MTQRTIYTFDDISRLQAKGSAERSRVLAKLATTARRRIANLAKSAYARFTTRMEQARTARELRAMDARMLADIGLTPGEIDLAARGEIERGSLRRPACQAAANESVAPAVRTSPKAA